MGWAPCRGRRRATFIAMQPSTRGGGKVFRTSDDAGAEIYSQKAGLKKDIEAFMKELDDEYIPAWPSWNQEKNQCPPGLTTQLGRPVGAQLLHRAD